METQNKMKCGFIALMGVLPVVMPSTPAGAAGAAGGTAGGAASAPAGAASHPHHVWVEAEWLGPIAGANYSFQQESATTKGTWSPSGPGVAAEWTQGGESEFSSIASRADEAAGVVAGRDIEIPAQGEYTLWVRYADYRNKEEVFGVRIRQNNKITERTFGQKPIIDELDPMKLYWDWSFGWDSAVLPLEKGAARIEVFTPGPTQARRQIDCLALTTDKNYRPVGRQKPDFAAWKVLRDLQRELQSPGGLQSPDRATDLSDAKLDVAKLDAGGLKSWLPKEARPSFLWNERGQWRENLSKPEGERIEAPYGIDSPLHDEFLALYKGKNPPVYSHPLSGPVIHIPNYPAAFANGSPLLDWLGRHPDQKFAVLLNYGEPNWGQNNSAESKAAVYANLRRFQKQFVGFIAGENIAYASPDHKVLEARVRAAKTRGEVLAALRDVHTAATVAKFSDYFGKQLTPAEAWGPVISCLSGNMETYCHALANWGVQKIGHENTGNSPTLARRLAFLRGAARQFGVGTFNYQSINLGDSATMFSREQFHYPGSSRYILDNQYDVWAGAGVNWLLKDYALWHMAGVDAFYNEQGVDVYWKPGGIAAGDNFPIQLSPKGKVTEAMQRIAERPRGAQYTPVAFLLDEAHGWSQERYEASAFGVERNWNPQLLSLGRHEASIRGWFDVAYYPAPETQNEPASGSRQGFVNGIFGDIFDVIVTTPNRTAIAASYPVLIASGEITLTDEWGKALRSYVQNGGTLVVSANQFSGPGVDDLGLPEFGEVREASSFTWTQNKQSVASNAFRYKALTPGKDRVLATAQSGDALCTARKIGKGEIIAVAVPLGLGINERPTPLLSLLMQHVTQGLVPIAVQGDVEWALNRLDNGGWVLTLLNNRGIIKPQHGILPTQHEEAQTVTLRVPFKVGKSSEWMTESPVEWQARGQGATAKVTVPAGAVRIVTIGP